MAQSVNLTKNVAYKSVAGTVSLTVERSVQPPKKEKEIVKPHSASLQYGLNTWRNGAAGTVEYQQSSNISYCPTCRDNCIGKLWRIPVLEMAHSTASKEEKKLKNNRRYQYSVEELFLIPWRHQFLILDFFLIPPLGVRRFVPHEPERRLFLKEYSPVVECS